MFVWKLVYSFCASGKFVTGYNNNNGEKICVFYEKIK